MIYMVTAPDEDLSQVDDRGLADFLREHGPEAAEVFVTDMGGGGSRVELRTGMYGADDRFKYYKTELIGPEETLVATIDWDV